MHHRPRVLIVDDDKHVRTWVRMALTASEEFVVVGEARDGAEAIEHAVALSPDAVVMDLRMPVVDGYTALVMLKRRMPDIRVVVHSAEGEIDSVRNVRSLGVPVVPKTGDVDHLLDALRSATASLLSA